MELGSSPCGGCISWLNVDNVVPRLQRLSVRTALKSGGLDTADALSLTHSMTRNGMLFSMPMDTYNDMEAMEVRCLFTQAFEAPEGNECQVGHHQLNRCRGPMLKKI